MVVLEHRVTARDWGTHGDERGEQKDDDGAATGGLDDAPHQSHACAVVQPFAMSGVG